jgi:hypothetical protein
MKQLQINEMKTLIDQTLSNFEEGILYGILNNEWNTDPKNIVEIQDKMREIRGLMYSVILKTAAVNNAEVKTEEKAI